MADVPVSATDLVLLSSEELKPAKIICAECDRIATRSDGKCSQHSGFRLTTAERRRAAAEMVARHQTRYAKLLMQGAEIAAAKGNTEPAQWALVHGGAIKPVEKTATTNVGVVVHVGAVLPGLRED